MLNKAKGLVIKFTMLFLLTFAIGASNLFAGDFKLWAAESNPIWTNYFADTLDVGESKTKTIHANERYNWTGVKLIEGQTYKFTVGSPEWNNNIKETNAEGYPDRENIPLPHGPRRFPAYNWMALLGSLYTYQDKYSYTGKTIIIGLGRTWKATKTGFMSGFANDCEECYGDNSRVVTLTIKRIE
jgi:hypothetical protein